MKYFFFSFGCPLVECGGSPWLSMRNKSTQGSGYEIGVEPFNMASRGHVGVNERRLRPVYGTVSGTFLSKFYKRTKWLAIFVSSDALDSQNNKQAIQLADKILKKQKDLHCAKVCLNPQMIASFFIIAIVMQCFLL